MFFRNCLPFLRLLEGRIVVFLTPLARYLLSSCCNRADHAPNRQDEEFGEQLQKALQDCRNFFKDFLFTSGLRGFAVVFQWRTRGASLSGERIQFIRSMKDTTGSWILFVLKRRG
jgi:outer membrane biogenesis lipoprotein LolB